MCYLSQETTMQKPVFYVEAGSFLKSLNEFLKVLLNIRTNTNWVKSFVTVKLVVPAFGIFLKKCSLEKKCVLARAVIFHITIFTQTCGCG